MCAGSFTLGVCEDHAGERLTCCRIALGAAAQKWLKIPIFKLFYFLRGCLVDISIYFFCFIPSGGGYIRKKQQFSFKNGAFYALLTHFISVFEYLHQVSLCSTLSPSGAVHLLPLLSDHEGAARELFGFLVPACEDHAEKTKSRSFSEKWQHEKTH